MGRLERRNFETISRVTLDRHIPYLLYAASSATATLTATMGRPALNSCSPAPKPLPPSRLHSQSGISHRNVWCMSCWGLVVAGNSRLPQELRTTLLENNAGLPPFMFYDHFGSDDYYGDYLDLRLRPARKVGLPGWRLPRTCQVQRRQPRQALIRKRDILCRCSQRKGRRLSSI